MGLHYKDIYIFSLWAVASVLISMFLAFILMAVISKNTMDTRQKTYRHRLMILSLLSGASGTVYAVVIDRII